MPRRSNIPDKIISILQEDPTITRKQLSQQLKVSYPAIQKHLNKLEKDKVVIPAFRVEDAKIKKSIFWIFILSKNPQDVFFEKTEEGRYRLIGNRADADSSDYQRAICKEIAASFQENNSIVEGLTFGGVHIVLGGQYDIILRIFSDDQDAVGNYVTRFLRTRPDIVQTSTAWSLRERKGDVEKQSISPPTLVNSS